MTITELCSRTKRKACLIIPGTLLLASCALMEQGLISTSLTEPAHYSPIAYYNWVESATPEQLELERQRLESAYDSDSRLSSSVQYAVVLSKMDSEDGFDSTEITTLLNEHLNEYETAADRFEEEYRTFGTLWQRQHELQMLYEEAKEASRLNTARIQELESRIRELQTTIKAFTSIERELSERGLDDENAL